MKRVGLFLFFFCCCLALALAQAVSISSAPVPAGSYVISATELSRLIGISQRLDELNAKLQIELSDSRAASERQKIELDGLKLELVNSRSEVESWRAESEALRIELGELRKKLSASSTESTGLREALAKAETSSANWERSWKEYEAEVERKVRNITMQRNIAVAVAVVFLVLSFLGR